MVHSSNELEEVKDSNSDKGSEKLSSRSYKIIKVKPTMVPSLQKLNKRLKEEKFLTLSKTCIYGSEIMKSKKDINEQKKALQKMRLNVAHLIFNEKIGSLVRDMSVCRHARVQYIMIVCKS